MKRASLGLALGLALVACGGESSSGVFEAQGAVTAASGKTAPAAAALSAVWTVSSGSPDYSYAYGAGTATSDGFDLSFPAAPPADALNTGGIGVAILVLLPEGQALADGKLSSAAEDALSQAALGAAGGYAVVYKKAGAAGISWIDAFPEGYSCAKGVPATSDTFDTFTPVDCAEVVITVDSLDNIEFTNWT